ncbi:hypothetical protein CLOM_g19907 [Closterium sp. NIES-68]|nr:hypothetical protein CLOM_g19907 [Closterium sp. NIES-68]
MGSQQPFESTEKSARSSSSQDSSVGRTPFPTMASQQQSTGPVAQPPKGLFLALLAFRLINSLAVQTYFNPDEFWQGPEVAHRMVFGYGYLTWEWQPEWAARSFLHPMLFAAGYQLLALLRFDTPWLVRHSPRFIQASIASVADLRLYVLTQRLFPSNPSAAAWALACNLCCWFLFFCATRTFSNSLEASLAVIALSFWPWRRLQRVLQGGREGGAQGRGQEKQEEDGSVTHSGSNIVTNPGANRPLALALAAAACMVRPTSTPFWLPLGLHELLLLLVGGTLKGGKKSRGGWEWLWLLVLEVLPIGVTAVAISVAIDSWQYGRPMVFTPLNLLHFNIHLKGSSLYGSNPWHWYWSQGLIAMHASFFPSHASACSGVPPSSPPPPPITHLVIKTRDGCRILYSTCSSALYGALCACPSSWLSGCRSSTPSQTTRSTASSCSPSLFSTHTLA